MTWKGRPLSSYNIEGSARGGMSVSFRCLVCDLAYSLRMSEDEFYNRYDMHERAQLLATYRSQLDRRTVMAIAPAKPPQ